MNSRAYIGKSFWDSSRRAQSTVAEQSLAPLSDEYEGPGHGEVVGSPASFDTLRPSTALRSYSEYSGAFRPFRSAVGAGLKPAPTHAVKRRAQTA